jgi:hypothetical protein
MRFKFRSRFIAFELKGQLLTRWGILDRQTGELIEKSKIIQRYPESWARKRADEMNKDQAHENNDQKEKER